MQIQHLAYLAAVAREGHFGRAAQACHVTQPTLSNGIRRLEQELGVALVRRGHRYEGLRPEGERMLAWAHRILADSDGMQMDAVAMREGLAGRLRLGVIPTALPALTLTTSRCAASGPCRSTTSATCSSRPPTAATGTPTRSPGSTRRASGCAC
jgi:DNA-binding transcriptional LysR family regulator